MLTICDALRDLIQFVQSKNVKNTHGGMLLLAKVQAKSYTPPWVFSRFLIVQMAPNCPKRLMYKSFVRPYRDYANIMFDQPYNNSSQN